MSKAKVSPVITIVTSMTATTVEELNELAPAIERMGRDATVNTNDLIQRLEKSIDSLQPFRKHVFSKTTTDKRAL